MLPVKIGHRMVFLDTISMMMKQTVKFTCTVYCVSVKPNIHNNQMSGVPLLSLKDKQDHMPDQTSKIICENKRCQSYLLQHK